MVATLLAKDLINATATVQIADDNGTVLKTITYAFSAGDDANALVLRVNTDIVKLTAAATILGPIAVGQAIDLTPPAAPVVPDAVRQQVALVNAIGARQQAAQCVALGMVGADGTIDSTLSPDVAAALAPIADTVTSVAAVAAATLSGAASKISG